MEVEDCAAPLHLSTKVTSNPSEAFDDVDVAILIGALPKKSSMTDRVRGIGASGGAGAGAGAVSPSAHPRF